MGQNSAGRNLLGGTSLTLSVLRINLVLEIDGSSHEQADGKTNDVQRTAWLNSEGFKVVRFWNREVINDIEGVLGKIRLLL